MIVSVTRLERERAGMGAITLGFDMRLLTLQLRGLDDQVDVFKVRVDIQCLGAWLTRTITRLLDSSKWHVRFAAKGSGINYGHTSVYFLCELNSTMIIRR